MKIEVQLGERTYPVYIDNGSLGDTGALISQKFSQGKVLLVTDENTNHFYGNDCSYSLECAGFQVYRRVISPGEGSKNMAEAMALYDEALKAGLGRSDIFIALGGGVVGDLAGFAAATFLRGIPFVQIPTSLLAQVDSSVGGKVGINHQRGKNLIGAFHQPSMVIIDLLTLKTLPAREFDAGLGEVFKYGLLGGEEMFSWLEDNGACLVNNDWDEGVITPLPHCQGLNVKGLNVIREAVARSIKIKAEVVEKDERENGLRRILNLGHTFGHALEAATGYSYYLHGEAVVIGIKMAVATSLEMSLLDEDTAGRILAVMDYLKVKEPPIGLDMGEVFERLSYDKKKVGDTVNFILPVAIGEVIVKPDLPVEILKRIIGDYLNSN